MKQVPSINPENLFDALRINEVNMVHKLRFMKKLYFLFIIMAWSIAPASAQVSINTTGNQPHSSAMLDVSASNKGLLMPRVALTSADNASPVASPATGLMVYNTAAAGTSPYKVCPGLYYWSGSMWIRFSDGIDCGNGSPLPDGCDPEHTIIDIDGNVYPTIVIGTREWMARNLKVSHYRNGDEIPNVTDRLEWIALSSGAYCWYNNNQATFEPLYGKLYNWYVVNDSRNLCPSGWHVPTDTEWATLIDLLGGYSVAGGKIKETGTTHWYSPNTGATNETCFTALGGGCRNFWDNSNANFNYYMSIGWWWSSTQDPDQTYRAFFYDCSKDNTTVYRNSVDKRQGNSVRCIKD